MKKRIIIVSILCVVAFLSSPICSYASICHNEFNEDYTNEDIISKYENDPYYCDGYLYPSTFKLDKKTITLNLGEYANLNVIFPDMYDVYNDYYEKCTLGDIEYTDLKFSYKRSNKKILNVLDGVSVNDDISEQYSDYVIEAKKAGTCYITFNYMGYKQVCKVIVKNSYSLDSSVRELMNNLLVFDIKTSKKFIKRWTTSNQNSYNTATKYKEVKNYLKNTEFTYKIKKKKNINKKKYVLTVKFRYEDSKKFLDKYGECVAGGVFRGEIDDNTPPKQQEKYINKYLKEAATSYKPSYSNKTLKLTFVKKGNKWMLESVPAALEDVIYANMQNFK